MTQESAYYSKESGNIFYLNKDGKYQRLNNAFEYTLEQMREFCTPIPYKLDGKDKHEKIIIIDNRLLSDYTFATRFKSFLKGVTVNCAMAQEELEYMERVAERLLNHQISTAKDQSEIDYLKGIHTNC